MDAKTKALQIRPSTSVQVVTPQERAERADTWPKMEPSQRKRSAITACKDYNEHPIDDDRHLAARLTLKGLLTSYAETFLEGTDATLATYWQGAERLLTWCRIEKRLAHSLDGDQLKRFTKWLSIPRDPKRKDELKPKTVQTHFSGARAFIDALKWVGAVKGDPFQQSNGQKVTIRDRTKPEDKVEHYEDDEIKRLLEGANDRECALILLGIDGGLRVDEMRKTKWSDIDAKRLIIKISGKGKKDVNQLVTKRTIDALQAMKVGDPSGMVFNLGTRRIQEIFGDLCKKVRITPRGVHALRHTCGTRLYRKTRDLLVVKRHLRHSNISTVQIYAHLADEDYKAAVEMLESNGYA